MRAVAVLAERHIGLQCECGNGVLTRVLPSVWDRRGFPEVIETPAKGRRNFRESRRDGTTCTMDHQLRQYVEPRVVQRSVVDWKQDVVDGAIHPSRAVVRLPTSGADNQHRPLS